MSLEREKKIDISRLKDTFRKAALEKLIDDPEIWFDFQHKRNLMGHTYEQSNLDAIVAIFDQFSDELAEFIDRITVDVVVWDNSAQDFQERIKNDFVLLQEGTSGST